MADRSQPAPSAPIAVAARAFGDDYPLPVSQWPLRLAAVTLVGASVWYVPWLVGSLNDAVLWLAVPFAAANVFTVATVVLSVVNSWRRSIPPPRPLFNEREPFVGVIVPTYGEPVPMVLRTVLSILEQDWPLDRMAVVVSDDAANPELRDALADWPVRYHLPTPRWAPERAGAAKAGNLNSALALLRDRYPQLAYVETRDADDELGSNAFLRQCAGQLEDDTRLAFVQTIKEAQVAAGGPFNNRERSSTGARCRRETARTRCSRAGRAWSGAPRRSRRSATSRRGTSSRTCSRASRPCGAAGAASTCRSSARCRSTRRTTCRTSTSSAARGRSTRRGSWSGATCAGSASGSGSSSSSCSSSTSRASPSRCTSCRSRPRCSA